MCELRTMPQGHPDYRFICQEMWRKIQEVHPALAECRQIHRLERAIA
jgi:thymidylate synthase ThyX